MSIDYQDNDEAVTISIDLIDENPQNLVEFSAKKIEFHSSKSSLITSIPKSKIKGTILESKLNAENSDFKNYLKLAFNTNNIPKFTIKSFMDCLEYINDSTFDLNINDSNMLEYYIPLSIFNLTEKKEEVQTKILNNLTDENLVYFIKIVEYLKEEKLFDYVYFLTKHLINVELGLPGIKYESYDFKEILHFDLYGRITFDENNIYYINPLKKNNITGNPTTAIANTILPKTSNIFADLNFLRNVHVNQNEKKKKFYRVNNCFNMGKVYRMRSDENFVSDYPHFYQMKLENDPEINLYALRESENSNFILSTNIDDFSKNGPFYLGEIVCNFWGTYFEVFSCGIDPASANLPSAIISKKVLLGTISYETNIMGECPRIFKIDAYEKGRKKVHLENFKPHWSDKLQCYCLNFYGRVKKASAKNFQIIVPGDEDNILLQHGKVNKNEFNIDFREPFCPVLAFAVSLVGIGKKRVVS